MFVLVAAVVVAVAAVVVAVVFDLVPWSGCVFCFPSVFFCIAVAAVVGVAVVIFDSFS